MPTCAPCSSIRRISRARIRLLNRNRSVMTAPLLDNPVYINNITEQKTSHPTVNASPSQQKRELISFPEGQQLKCKYDTIIPVDNNYKADYSSLKQVNITVVYLRKNNVLNTI